MVVGMISVLESIETLIKPCIKVEFDGMNICNITAAVESILKLLFVCFVSSIH